MVHQTVGPASYRDKVPYYPQVKTSRGDPLPQIPTAGKSPTGKNTTVSQAMQYEFDPNNSRPPTPPEIKKYRRSFKQEPGKRFINTGVFDQNFPESSTRYGCRTIKGDRVGDAFDQVPHSELSDFLNEQKESIYRSNVREPLGASYNRGHVLPGQTSEENYRFGQVTSTSESSKDLIYFKDGIPDKRARSSRSPPLEEHQSAFTSEREVTRPVDRNYDWDSLGIDPLKHRFGKVSSPLINGVKQALTKEDTTSIGSKRVEQIKQATHDHLGKARPQRGALRQLGEHYVHGKTMLPDEWGVKKCIHGAYSEQEQEPDRDLGRSTRSLAVLEQIPADSTRVYGVPTIRHDREKPKLRSVADPFNYGDESNAQGLLYPNRFAHDGVNNSDFLAIRDQQEIRELFRRIGQNWSDEEFQSLCDAAERDFGGISADSVRHAWNKQRNSSRLQAAGSSIGS